MGTPTLEFDSDVKRRVYEYVEARGSAAREEVRDAVRVAETAGAKPPRSGTEPAARLSVPECNEYIDELLDAGPLAERGGTLYVAPDAEAESHEADGFEYVVRPADEGDREAVADLIRSVAAEGAIVVDERVADAIEREGALVRLNDRESRMFFVSEVRDAATERTSTASDAERSSADSRAAEPRDDGETASETPGDDDDDGDGEIVGWVHVHGFELPAREHTAELTVGVAPEYRDQGVGGNLLECGMAWAAEEGCLKVYQSLPATNEEALEMLEAHGWEREATRSDHYRVGGDLVDEVQLATRLDD